MAKTGSKGSGGGSAKTKIKKRKTLPVKAPTRKEQRKLKQLQKKQNKRLFFSEKRNSKQPVEPNEVPPVTVAKEKAQRQKGKTKKRPEPVETTEQWLSGDVKTDDDESIDSDLASIASEKERKKAPPTKRIKKQTTAMPDASTMRRRELERQKDLEVAARKQRVKQMRRDNEEEDKMISRLEKKLKLNKTKDKNRLVRKMFNDGLDYALEFCLDDDEEREKLELKQKRKLEAQRQMDDEDSDSVSIGTDELFDNNENDGSEDYASIAPSEEDENTTSDSEDESAQYKEDIYGRKRDKDGKIILETAAVNEKQGGDGGQAQKYIPPHQRALLAAAGQGNSKQAELLERLRKGCKGLLNRLSEANLHKIATGIEDLYMRNSRNNMNATLAALLNEALIGRTVASERMVQEHMVLLAYLHAHIGSEIGAHFLQLFVQQFATLVADIGTLPQEDKRLNNIVLVLAYMYIFKLYEHRLLLDLIARLTEALCEKTIECLLLLFQSIGFKLRKDDPLAFKQMMLAVQQKIAAAPLELKENLRLKFMVDILNAVKNNNISKLPSFDPELAETLRKKLKGMLRNDKYVVTLNLSVDDLLQADSVGKWWVVGSAWSGNVDNLPPGKQQKQQTGEGAALGGNRFSEKLLALARKQKMNTEERRNVFCIVMSAEDYVDAFEKILHLAVKDQRTIAYVIIHCCVGEQRANPYYSHLALKFCNYSRKFQLAFQFASWDRMNEIDALGKQQIRNLASFLQHLIASGGLTLAVLKVVNFLQLNKASLLLMRECVGRLLLDTEEADLFQAFERVAKNPKLGQFKNSLRLFMQHFLLQDDDGAAKLRLDADQLALLKKRVDYVDKILAYVDL